MKSTTIVLLALAVRAFALPSKPLALEHQAEERDVAPQPGLMIRGGILNRRAQIASTTSTSSRTTTTTTTTTTTRTSSLTTKTTGKSVVDAVAQTTTTATTTSAKTTTTTPKASTTATTMATTTTTPKTSTTTTTTTTPKTTLTTTTTTTPKTTLTTTTTTTPKTTTTTTTTTTPKTTTTTTTTKKSSTTTTTAAAATNTIDVTNMSYQQAMLTVHNLHRANASLPNLVWSDSLTNTAQKIADSCKYGHNVDEDGGGYGQNIGAGAPGNSAAGLITNLMYNGEINYYPQPYGVDDADLSNFHIWGHYSQMVWGDTTDVGCVTKYCPGGLANTPAGVAPYFTVCNFYPPGNYVGEFSSVAEPQGGPSYVVVGGS